MLPGITDAQLDEMPAFILDRAFHRVNKFDDVPKLQSFHGILEDVLSTRTTNTNQEIMGALEEAYRRLFDVPNGAPSPDVWIVTKDWLVRKKGIQ